MRVPMRNHREALLASLVVPFVFAAKGGEVDWEFYGTYSNRSDRKQDLPLQIAVTPCLTRTLRSL